MENRRTAAEITETISKLRLPDDDRDFLVSTALQFEAEMAAADGESTPDATSGDK